MSRLPLPLPHRTDRAAHERPPTAPVALLVLAAGVTLLFVLEGQAKPALRWNWLDIVSEGGTALLAAWWCLLVLGARPDGRVTRLLAAGLAAMALGAWTDCMDEFYRLDPTTWWNHGLEGLMTPLGMVLLSLGLLDWRAEQYRLTEHLRQRERLWRDHRRYDRITELADGAYLRAQLQLELRRPDARACALLMLQTDGAASAARAHGPAEADRLLQAQAHLLLLNLRCDDLLVRLAGERYAVLLPGLDAGGAQRTAAALERALASLCFHARSGAPLPPLRVRTALAMLDDPRRSAVDAAIARLGRELVEAAPQAAP